MDSKERVLKTVREIAPVLSELPEKDYVFIGSGALVLSGLKIENVHDLDLLTTEKNVDYLKERWKDRLLGIKKPDNLFRSSFAAFSFPDLALEVMGNLEINKKGSWRPVRVSDRVTHEDLNVPLPAPQELRKMLVLFGRDKDRERVRILDASGLVKGS